MNRNLPGLASACALLIATPGLVPLSAQENDRRATTVVIATPGDINTPIPTVNDNLTNYEVINLVRVSRAIVAGALARQESRGSHTRSDAPGADDRWLGRLVIQGDAAPRFVELPALAREGT